MLLLHPGPRQASATEISGIRQWQETRNVTWQFSNREKPHSQDYPCSKASTTLRVTFRLPNPHTWTAMKRWLRLLLFSQLSLPSVCRQEWADGSRKRKWRIVSPENDPQKAFLNQVHFVMSSRLCWILKKGCISISKEKVPICCGLHTSHFPPSRGLNNCFLWVPWHTVCVPINGPSHSLPGIPVICGPGDLPSSLWTTRGKKSTLFTLAAPRKLWLCLVHGGPREALTNACWSRKNVVDDCSACSSPEKPMKGLSLLVSC